MAFRFVVMLLFLEDRRRDAHRREAGGGLQRRGRIFGRQIGSCESFGFQIESHRAHEWHGGLLRAAVLWCATHRDDGNGDGLVRRPLDKTLETDPCTSRKEGEGREASSAGAGKSSSTATGRGRDSNEDGCGGRTSNFCEWSWRSCGINTLVRHISVLVPPRAKQHDTPYRPSANVREVASSILAVPPSKGSIRTRSRPFCIGHGLRCKGMGNPGVEPFLGYLV
eukprot:scaffold350_cov333-Pavlova_lutheri.AAC.10